MNKILCFVLTISSLSLFSCKKENTPAPNLIFKFRFDPTQARLNNIGQPDTIPAGNAGQNPAMNKMSAHYIELAPNALTQLGSGAVLFHAAETTTGGSTAIDFSKATLAGNNEQFFSIPLKDVAAGQYEYLRVSLAYQNYDVNLYLDTVINTGSGNITIAQDFPCTVASFVGYNTYITNYLVKNQSISVNANKTQGYWGAECPMTFSGYTYNYLGSGQSPAGATTVVNPLASTSPIPAGSCVATGSFGASKLIITGNETADIVVIVSLSVNKSFEWTDANGNNKWEPTKGENVVNMGIRGLIPIIQ